MIYYFQIVDDRKLQQESEMYESSIGTHNFSKILLDASPIHKILMKPIVETYETY